MPPITNTVSPPTIRKALELPMTQAPAGSLPPSAESLRQKLLKDTFEGTPSLPQLPVMLADSKPKVFLPPNTYGVNGSDAALASRASPDFTPEAWADPAVIVSGMTQHAPGSTGDDTTYKCGPTNLLASALLQGKEVGAKYLAAAAKSSNLTPDQRQQLAQISDNVKAGKSSFTELSTAQDLLYRVANTRMGVNEVIDNINQLNPRINVLDRSTLDEFLSKTTHTPEELEKASNVLSRLSRIPIRLEQIADPRDPTRKVTVANNSNASFLLQKSGLDDGELIKHAKGSGLNAKASPYNVDASAPAAQALAGLKPGQSAVIRLGGSDASSTNDHYVTVGVLKDGRPFIYNPDPSKGDATLSIGTKGSRQSDAFKAQLERYDNRSLPDDSTAGNKIKPMVTKISY